MAAKWWLDSTLSLYLLSIFEQISQMYVHFYPHYTNVIYTWNKNPSNLSSCSKRFYSQVLHTISTPKRSHWQKVSCPSDIQRRPQKFDPSPLQHYLVAANYKWKMGQIFVIFSECLNFMKQKVNKILKHPVHGFFLQPWNYTVSWLFALCIYSKEIFPLRKLKDRTC